MNFHSPDLEVYLRKITANQNSLYFKFKGQLSTEISARSINIWTAYMNSNPSATYEIVLDLTELKEFKSNARRELLNTIKRYKSRIAKVYIVSPKFMIREKVKIVLRFFGVQAEVEKAISRLPDLIRL